MNRFLEMKERGETILFSEILENIPPDDVLAELFPDLNNFDRSRANHREMQILKLRLDGLTQPQIAEKMNLTQGQVSYSSARIKNALHGGIPPYIEVDIPALKRILRMT